MWGLRAMSLRTKVFALTLGIAALGMTLGAALLLSRHRSTLRDSTRRHAEALAASIAEYEKGELARGDAASATRALEQLGRHGSLQSATLRDLQGNVFAAYGVEAGHCITVEHAVVQDGRPLGVLRLSVSTEALEQQLQDDTTGAVILCLLLLSVYALATARVQRLVTDPILALVASMRRVGHDNRLDERLAERRDDEVGSLYRGFNTMLEQLRERANQRDQSEARLRALIRSLPDLVYVMNERGDFVEVLCRHAKFLPEGKGRGMRVSDSLPADAVERLARAVESALDSHETQRFDYIVQHTDRAFYAEATVTPLPLRDADGTHLLLVVVRDLTERRELELQLLQSQKLDAVGQLAGGIAHDFNNLLAGILGFAELIRDGSPRLDRAWLASEIIRVAEQAAQLTSRLLGFARRTKAQSVPTDVNQLIVRVGSILERTIDRRIHVAMETSPRPCWVKADAAQLESAVLNLALNARDAMPQGGNLTLSVRSVELGATSLDPSHLAPDQALPPSGAFVELCVRDTGTGIDGKLRAKIFEPFFTTKDPGKGSGLGLAAVLGAARAHRGALLLETAPGQGTTFKLLLPTLQVVEPLEASPKISEAPLTHVQANILLVDDDESAAHAARMLLEDEGYLVAHAKHGREALDILSQAPGRFDLVIMDMIMPEMSGAEAMPHVRALAPELPILIASGYSAEPSQGVEADGFLHKPYTRSELSRLVKTLIQARSATHAVPGRDGSSGRAERA